MTPRLVLLREVTMDGIGVPGERSRALLALLADDLGAGASTGASIAALWPDDPPAHPAKALQVVVSRTRARIGAELIAGTAAGYRLALAPAEVDAAAVRTLAARARDAQDPAVALAAAEEGLALFGPVPAGDRAGERAVGVVDPVAAVRLSREPVRGRLLRSRALALAGLGRAEAGSALEELLAARPRDEELLVALLRVEASTRGPASALARFADYRESLADELGADPGAALRAEHARLLGESAPRRRRGIVHDPNPLVGRDADVVAVLRALRGARVVTVLGPGGLGKTRLVHTVAARAEERTVQVVSLAGVRTGEDVPAEVVEQLGVLSRAPSPVDAILDGLGTGSALLVLDNCEHVLDAAAALTHALVARSPEIRVLATSRAPLGLAAEAVYPLSELDAPTTAALFRARALAARPDADLPESEVAALCARLDGLPLAVELAAARVRVLSVAEIHARLADRFALLRGGARDAPERHRTLDAVVGWSWNLLSEKDRAAVRLLSALPGGFTADTAEHLLGEDPLDLLESLVDQSLLRPPDPAGRFRMLETVAEYGALRRREAGESAQVTARLLSWARALGRDRFAAPFGADPRPALAAVRVEQDNLLHVLRLALAERDVATVAAVAAALGALWTAESAPGRLLGLGADVLPALSRHRPADRIGHETRLQAVAVHAALAVLVDPRAAVRPLAVLRRLDPGSADSSAGALARVLRTLPDTAALAALCAGPEPLVAAIALGVVGYVQEARGDLPAALATTERMAGRMTGRSPSRATPRPGESRDAGWDAATPPWLQAFVHGRLAELTLQLERHAEALRHTVAAAAAAERYGVDGDPIGLGLGLVLAHLGLGDTDSAARELAAAAPPVTLDGEVFDRAARAELALATGRTEEGLAGWRAAVALFDGATPGWLVPYAWSARATAVVAHVRHGRLDDVLHLARGLPAAAGDLLDAGVPDPLCGSLLVGWGVAEWAQGRRVRGAWLVALAERFHYQREYQPTMSSAAIRAHVAGPAYAEASSEYAGLSREDLRAAAVEAAAAYRERV